MRIQNNLMAMNTHRQLGANQAAQAKSTEKLSSGYRINRAGDDAAGLSISEKMRAQVRGLNRASSNAQDGISLIQAAEGALQESHSILQRMRELAVQGANDINATEDRGAITDEINQLGLELDRIATTTNFNGKYILSGAYENPDKATGGGGDNIAPELADERGVTHQGALNIQVGANTLGSDVIQLFITGVGVKDLLTEDMWGEVENPAQLVRGEAGFVPGVATAPDGYVDNVTNGDAVSEGDSFEVTTYGFQALVNVLDGLQADTGAAIEDGEPKTGIALISELRSTLGATQNRLEHTVANLDTVAENVQSAESRIKDVDMAKEMMSFTKNNILNQAATAMLAQANQAPQTVLSLIR